MFVQNKDPIGRIHNSCVRICTLGLLSTLTGLSSAQTCTPVEFAKIIPADTQTLDRFGHAVSVSGDFNIIGADHDAPTWTQENKLLPDDGTPNDRFGYSVSISGDRVVVGSFAHADNGLDAGSAYLFMHDDAGWVQQGELLATDGEVGDHFGRSVAISGDNIFVGAYFDNDAGLESGSAYVFNIECTTSCPADLTGDGTLNFFDISAFLSAFSIQDPVADFTGDGTFNFYDISAFLSIFSSGCP